MPKIRRALVSLSDKSGIIPFCRALGELGVEILSTGGTCKLLRENKIAVIEVSDYTGQPEILDGRLKTLHPRIHGGILAIRSNKKHEEELKRSGIQAIDMVVVNLYPFEETVALTRPSPELGTPSPAEGRGQEGPSLQEAIEQIDIGGPTMLRAAAKNWQDVTVVCDPGDYIGILEELHKGAASGAPTISRETNFRLAQKVFALTARYEAAISNYLSGGMEGKFPQTFTFQGEKIQDLRYGENPHQRGAFYREGRCEGVTDAKQLHGKELSFNNILDLEAAIETVKEFETAACVIIKHTNPCGVSALTLDLSPVNRRGEEGATRGLFIAARSCDPLSAFGGIVAINREIDPQTAEQIGKDFYECVVAPSFSKEAFEILARKKNIRLMELPSPPAPPPRAVEGAYDIKKVSGGFLLQDLDAKRIDIRRCPIVTKKRPSDEEWAALDFAWRVVKHLKSNAIVIAGEEEGILKLFGAGAGQMSRIDSVRIAISKFDGMDQAFPLTKPVVLASDAFFPFRDSVDEAAEVGVTAIIQPGGSLKDQESIDAANEQGIAMVFTGTRHFRH